MTVLIAAHLLGYGAIWQTGESCHDPLVKQALGLRPGSFNAGWLFVGTAVGNPPGPARPDPDAFLELWNGPP